MRRTRWLFITDHQPPQDQPSHVVDGWLSHLHNLKHPCHSETAMDSQRFLRCLGQPALIAPNGDPVRFRTRKHLALLVYLAVENRSHRRDRLGEFLWPKVSVAEARHSLATALSVLRPRVGLDALETTRDQVRLLPGSIRLDLDRLEAGDVLGTEVTSPLEVAAFLDGFEITDSQEFTHWKDRIQARLLPIIKDALLVLMDRCRRTGDTRQIERLADRMLALDELSEEAIRAKMEARAFAGDRLTALEIFEAWKKKLAEELQAVPSDLVEGMAVRLRRRGWERTTAANIPNVPTDQWRGRPFIGRAAEYQVLYELWDGVRKGVPGHALVLGDSGVGKTTLVQRLTTAAGLEGAAISRVQCYDVEREIPYSTLSGLIIGLLDRPGVSATSPEALAELSRTVPQVRQRFPNLPKPNDSQGETARIRLTEAFLELLTAIAEEHPVILVVDDLHFADDVSLAVLHLVMRRARGQPIMVVFLARTGEISQSAHAIRIRENASSLGIGEIELAPLSDTESREMLRSLVETDEPQPGISEQRAILRAAAGFPMILELLVQDWKASADQCLAVAVDAMTLDLRIRESTGSAYIRILDRLTRSLDNITQNVLNVAAILGQRLNDLSMYGIVDLSAGQTIVGMTELVARRVLRDGPRGLEFANEFVRAAAYIGVTPSLRQVLHGEIAERLIQAYSTGSDDLGLEIAWHCTRGGRCEEATGYLLKGASRAKQADALHEGEIALSSALLQSHLTSPQRGDAVLLLAEILQEQGRWADSLQLLETEMQRDLSLDSTWVRILSLAAKFHIYGRTPQETVEDIQFLNEVIGSAGENSIRLAAADMVATLVGMLRDEARARQSLEAIGSISLAGLTPQELSKLSLAKARLAFHLHDKDATLREIETALPQIDSTQELSATAAQFRAGLAALSCMDAQYLNGARHFEKAREMTVRLGNDTLRARFTAGLALAYGRLGNYDKQLQYSQETLSVSLPQFVDYHQLLATYCAGLASIFLGLHTNTRQLISSVNVRITESLPAWAFQAWHLYSADLYLLLGDHEESRKMGLCGTTGRNSSPHLPNFAGIFCRWKAILASDDDDIKDAFRVISSFVRDLSSYDALDRAEILASVVQLKKRRGMDCGEAESILLKQLSTLPTAVIHQLCRLGLSCLSNLVNTTPASSIDPTWANSPV